MPNLIRQTLTTYYQAKIITEMIIRKIGKKNPIVGDNFIFEQIPNLHLVIASQEYLGMYFPTFVDGQIHHWIYIQSGQINRSNLLHEVVHYLEARDHPDPILLYERITNDEHYMEPRRYYNDWGEFTAFVCEGLLACETYLRQSGPYKVWDQANQFFDSQWIAHLNPANKKMFFQILKAGYQNEEIFPVREKIY